MRKFIFFSVLGFQLSYSQNLVNNGDFESWNNGSLSYWKKSPTDASISNAAQYTGNGTNGTFACKLPIGPNSTGRISQYMTSPSRYIKVTFRYFFPTISAGRSLQLQLAKANGSTAITIYNQTIDSGTVGVWQNFTTIYDYLSNNQGLPPSIALYIFSNGFDFNNVSPYIVIDDVKVTSSFDLASLSTNENPELKNIKILNPIKDNLYIQTTEKIEKIEIYNINGQSIKILEQGEYGVSDLFKGVYFLTIHTSKGILTKKIIKE